MLLQIHKSRGLAEQRSSRRGQAIFIFVAAFAMIAGMLGLVLDGGRIYLEKRRAQAAADAGAAGAVQEMRRGLRDYTDDVRPAAVNDTGLHDYTDGNATITVNNPPLSGASVGNSDFVEVIVAKNVPTTFMRIFGPQLSTVRARAVAGLQRSGDACVIALEPSAGSALWANGGGVLNAECGIISNSTASNALRTNGGGATISSTTYVGTTGGYSGSGFTPEPETGILPAIDPFLNFTPSTSGPAGYTTTAATSSAFGGYTASAKNGNGGNGNANGNGNGGSNGGGGTTTYYWPGYYSSSIDIQNGNVVFMPGDYILEAGMKITGGTVSGSEVFFYNINSGGNDFYDVGGNASITLSAQTSGDNQGMLFASARRSSPTGNPGNKIRGSSTSTLTGAIYLPSEHLDWAGNPASSVSWGMVVANTIQVSGTADSNVINPPTESQAPKTYRMSFSE